MLDLAAWGPTIVTLIMWVFFGGVAWATLRDHGKRIAEIEETVKELVRDVTTLKAFREGWAAARAIYERGTEHLATAGGD